MVEILLTGGTGLIGPAVAMTALERGVRARWTLLVRGAGEADARERLVQRWARHVGRARAASFAAECEIVCGDLLDMAANEDPRLDRITHVLHLAADTSFRSRETNWRVNYDGTLALAERMARAPRLERFLHVGTAMICGRNGAARVVREDEFPHAAADHLTEYTRSKAAAELALEERFPAMPVVVARPSIVAGHTALGLEPTASIFWSILLGNRLRLVSNDVESGLDVVPFDWVSQALLFLLQKPQLAHRRYHLSAGRHSRSSWLDVDAAIAAGRGTPNDGPLGSFDAGARGTFFRDRFFRHFDRKDPLAVTMYMAQKKYYEFCALDVTFDNARLLAEGCPPPPPLAEYAAVCAGRPADIDVIEHFRDDLYLFEPAQEAPVTA